MPQKIRNYYAAGNTARGYHQFYHSVLQNLEQIYVITGAPGSGKSTLIREVGEKLQQTGTDIEWIHSPFHNGCVDGVVFPGLKAAVVDGTAPRQIVPVAPYAIEKYIDLSADGDFSSLDKHLLVQLHQEIADRFQDAYQTYAQALRIHDDWERFYITNMDYQKANDVTEELIHLSFGHETKEKSSVVRHMFLGAATPQGAKDHIMDLTSTIEKRYFIKGRPGSGKSTMLKKIAAEAEKRGFDAEVYHCGFDPKSLDMVILPEAGVAIFDSTAPHEYFPVHSSDEIVDMYERAIMPGTDEKFARELNEIKENYTAKMKLGTHFLERTRVLRDELVSLYQPLCDYSRNEYIKQELVSRLINLQ